MIPLFLASVLCRIIVFKTGENALHATPLPSGVCSYCCPIDVNRDIEYLVYTRRNPNCGATLNISDPYSLGRSNFNGRYPTVIFIHGYSESATGRSAVAIRDVYLKRGEYNVILVNWAKLAGLPWYVTAVRNTRIVGPQLARLVEWLAARGAVSLPDLHVIGFSLGAEIAGFMGKALSPRKVGRITGLDAAYPLYMNTGNEGHLARTDAAFVDVIHTDGGILGFPNPLGHVDFYPNGGKPKQPGCDETENAFQRSLSRFVNRLLWPSSRMDVLRRVGDESFRFPGQSMRKMAAGHPGGLQVDAPSVDGLRRGSRNEREVLLEDQRAATFREERDRLRVTFSFG